MWLLKPGISALGMLQPVCWREFKATLWRRENKANLGYKMGSYLKQNKSKQSKDQNKQTNLKQETNQPKTNK